MAQLWQHVFSFSMSDTPSVQYSQLCYQYPSLICQLLQGRRVCNFSPLQTTISLDCLLALFFSSKQFSARMLYSRSATNFACDLHLLSSPQAEDWIGIKSKRYVYKSRSRASLVSLLQLLFKGSLRDVSPQRLEYQTAAFEI